MIQYEYKYGRDVSPIRDKEAIMTYHPEKLAEHLTKIYSSDIFFALGEGFTLIHAYYHTARNNGFPIGMHSHTFYEINVVSAGSGYHYIEDKSLSVGKGDVFVLPPSTKHGYYTEDPNFEIFHILVHQSFIDRYQNELHLLPGYSFLFETEPLLRATLNEKLMLSLGENLFNSLQKDFNEMISYEMSAYTGAEIQKIAKLLYLISLFCELTENSHNPSTARTKQSVDSFSIVKAMDYIQNNYFEKFTLEELAKIANMSRSTFLRQFNLLCSCTPQQYLTRIRIAKAQKLLDDSDRTISNIAQDCGFFDSSHFDRIFRQEKGISPSAYRQNRRPQPEE